MRCVMVLAAALGTRVVLLGFLEATSIPGNNMLYLSPVAPSAGFVAGTAIAWFSVLRLRRDPAA